MVRSKNIVHATKMIKTPTPVSVNLNKKGSNTKATLI